MLAWVTGASSGIGRATALELASRGHIVLASARREDELNELAEEDDRIIPLPLDVTDFDGCKAAIDWAEKKYGPIELVILNAGIFESDPVVKLDRAAVIKHFDVNVIGMVNCLYAVLEGLLLRKRGRIVLTSSIAGYRGFQNGFSYCATKAALISMGETLRLELEPHRIKVQVICPSLVATKLAADNFKKMKSAITPQQAAQEIVRGINMGDDFQIRFNNWSTWGMAILRVLPDWMYFPIAERFMRNL